MLLPTPILTLHAYAVVPQVSTSNSALLSNITGTLAYALNRTKAFVNVGSNTIELKIDLSIPRILALPSTLSFPYKTLLSIYAGGQDVIHTTVMPINYSMSAASLSVHIDPRNTSDAANALAAAVNPLLSANPKVNLICYM